MPKNSVADLKSQKDSRAKQRAQEEAEAAADGRDPWDGKNRDGRLSMRVEEELLDAFDDSLPRHMTRTTAVRELLIRVAKNEIEL